MNGAMLESSLLETHFDAIPFGIYVVDCRTMDVIFVNRHFRDRQGEVTGRPCHEAVYGLPQPCHYCKIRQLTTKDGAPNGQTHIFELFNERDDRWYQLQEKAMSWPDGRVVKYSIAVDITELKETQNRLAEAHARLALSNKELAGANALLSEHVKLREHVDRIARHDLKSPLNGVINLPQILLERYDLPEEAAQMLRTIRESGLNMLDMINRSLDLYKLETGAYALKTEPVNLVLLAARTAASLTANAGPGRAGARIFQNGAPAAESGVLEVTADVMLCRTMLMNLVKNALEACPATEEVLVDISEEDGMAVISISNPGSLPEGLRERLFEKYVTSGKTGGTGLGAYSARLSAEAHGGRVELDSSTPGVVRVKARLPLTPRPGRRPGGGRENAV